MPPKPTLRNVRTGPAPSPQMETLPMPVFGEPAADPPAQPDPEPALDDAQVVALAAELGKADAATEQPAPVYPTSDGCQDPPPATLKCIDFTGLPREILGLSLRMNNLEERVGGLESERESERLFGARNTAAVTTLQAELTGLSARVDGLVSSLDPAVRERLAPVLAEVQALRSAPAQGLQAVVETVEGLRRAVSAVEARNPDAADVHGAVQQVRDEVSAFVRDFPARARSLWDEWRREVAVYSPPLDSPYARTHEPVLAQGYSHTPSPQALDGPVVEFTVLHRGVQFKPHQNPDGSVGLRLNIVPGAKHPMGEMSIPRTGEAVREVDFGYGVTVPLGWLADVTCAPLQPGQPSPQQRSYITTLGGSTPPGQTLVLQLHCASGARGVASGTEVCRLHLRRVEPAGLRVTDGVQTPLQAAVRTEEAARVLADKDAEIARLRALLESGHAHRLPQPMHGQHVVADGRGLVHPGVEAPPAEVPMPQRHWGNQPPTTAGAPSAWGEWSERGGKL